MKGELYQKKSHNEKLHWNIFPVDRIEAAEPESMTLTVLMIAVWGSLMTTYDFSLSLSMVDHNGRSSFSQEASFPSTQAS